MPKQKPVRRRTDLGSVLIKAVGMRKASVRERSRASQFQCATSMWSNGQSERLSVTISSSDTPAVIAATRVGLGLCHNNATTNLNK